MLFFMTNATSEIANTDGLQILELVENSGKQ